MNARTRWLLQYKHVYNIYLFALGICTITLSVYVLQYINPFYLSVLTACCLAYRFVLKKAKRKNGLFKNIVLACIWGVAPLLFTYKIIPNTYILFIVLQILGWSIQFDIFNKQVDKLHEQWSVVHYIGIYYANIISIAFILTSLAVLLIIGNTPIVLLLLMLQMATFVLSKNTNSYLYFYAVVDSMLLATAFILYTYYS